MKSNLERLQDLYNSEINFQISTLWDGGFDWKLGDDLNGFSYEGSEVTLELAAESLVDAALHKYPDSVFAKQTAPAATKEK